MAHRKAGGSAKSLRDSNPKYLGLKRADGQTIQPGEIILRQRGLRVLAGKDVKVGKDHTLFSVKTGIVRFTKKRKTNFTGKTRNRVVANVEQT